MRDRHRFVVIASVCVVVVLIGAAGLGLETGTAAGPAPSSVRDRALALLRSPAGRYMTSGALRGLQELAGVGPSAFAAREGSGGANAPARASTPAVAAAGLANVRVNDPHRDAVAPDQSTQSETTIAVHGGNVVVGYNDTQQSVPYRPTAGTTISGYSYSTDGGNSFTDAGALPNAGGFVNLGDPWLAADRAGTFFYSTLMLGAEAVAVGVAASSDGGKTFAAPVTITPTTDFYQADKPAIAVGRDPSSSHDNLYATFDDFTFDPGSGQQSAGLPVARSTDGGRTWSTVYADRYTASPGSCAFRQWIGAQPLVDANSGALRVFAERIDVPDCTFTTHFSQWVFTSFDGGRTFARHKIDDVTPVSDTGLLTVGPGQGIRTIEFPTATQSGSRLAVVWNDGAHGNADLRMATSTNGGATWSKSWLTTDGDDELMPAMTADTHGVHVGFYRVGAAGIAFDAADSADGTSFSQSRISSTTFPGTLTVPQFDPFVADGYMGDYTALVSDGARRFYAWGDNRDRVTDALYPQGRADPDVFFAHT